MFRFRILIQVTKPANVERDFCKECKGVKWFLSKVLKTGMVKEPAKGQITGFMVEPMTS